MSCTPKCWTPVDCPEHGREMWPAGRSAPLGTFECCELSGRPAINTRHLFSEHDSDRYYFDREGWDAHYSTCEQCNTELEESA